MQFGFSFDDTQAPTLVEFPHGTWNTECITHAKALDWLAAANVNILSLAGPARPLFAKGLELLQQKQASEQARMGDDYSSDSRLFFRGDIENTELETLAAFMRHCDTFAGTSSAVSGRVIEYKTKKTPRSKTFAMHVENVGTLKVHEYLGTLGHWPVSLSFEPCRSHFFLTSYADDAPMIEACGDLWRPSYCAQKLAEAKGHASVEPFSFNGRRYIVTGISTNGSYAEGNAWTFCRLEDWTGPVYTYAERNKAADDGRIERGDSRGLVILVRGKKCVIDGYAVMVDHRADLYKPDYSKAEADESDNLDFDSDDLDIEEAEDEEESFA